MTSETSKITAGQRDLILATEEGHFADVKSIDLQVFEDLFPLGGDVDCVFLESDEEAGLVLQVQVRKTREIKVASDGTRYVRRGAQSLPVTTPDAVKQLEYAKGYLESWNQEAKPFIWTKSARQIRKSIARVADISDSGH